MIPPPFDYHRVTSPDQAVSLLAEHDDARVLAGGQSLLPLLKLGLAEPALLVDLSGLPAADRVEDGPDGTRMGPMVRHRQVAGATPLTRRWSLLADAAEHLGDVQVRNAGTFVGSLAHADPAGDWPAVALALDVEATVTGPTGNRQVPVDELFAAAFTTSLGPAELIAHVTLPPPSAGTVSAYGKWPDPSSGYAVAGVAVVLDIDEGHITRARIACTGATTTPGRLTAVERLLVGRPVAGSPPAEVAAEVVVAARDTQGLSLNPDDGDHRLAVLATMTGRTVQRALTRAVA